jgi:protein-S-isoprenylcysteine O-methyltransferase Ste14
MSLAATLWTSARAIVYASAFAALWGWLAHEAHLRDVPFGFPLPGWVAPIGIALMAIGAVIDVACIWTFVVRGKGTPAPFDAPREFVAVAFGMLAASHLFAVLYEEPALERRFGDSYRAYRSRTRRWIPGPPRSPGGGRG